jgi:hypothetical protein
VDLSVGVISQAHGKVAQTLNWVYGAVQPTAQHLCTMGPNY